MGCFKEIMISEIDADMEDHELDLELELLDKEVEALDLRCREFEKVVYSAVLPVFESRYGFMKSHFELSI